jgi:HSP20 family molecular chaperone IbpA
MIKDMEFFTYMCGNKASPKSVSWIESLSSCEAVNKHVNVNMDYDLVDLGELFNLEIDLPNIDINSLKIFGSVRKEKTTLNITGKYFVSGIAGPMYRQVVGSAMPDTKYSPIHIGRRIGDIEFNIVIPDVVDLTRINADYRDGVVKMCLYKSSEHCVLINVSHDS